MQSVYSASFRHFPVYSRVFRSVPVFSNACLILKIQRMQQSLDALYNGKNQRYMYI